MFAKFFARRAAERKAKDEKAIASMPEPYCEDRRAHYFWSDAKFGCPMCAARREADYNKQVRDRYNAKMARAIVDEFRKRIYNK